MFALVLQLATTLPMCGLIWFVQVVHYPLFVRVGEPGFCDYAGLHATRTTYVVAPLMLAELASAGLFLLAAFRPGSVTLGEALAGAFVLIAIWTSTAVLQVPLHNRLQTAFSARDARRLVATNWLRTAGWSFRAVLVLRWTWLLIHVRP